jgi:FtsH-binding integral membrane protein
MNNKVYKIFEYAYLVMFILSVIAVISNWNSNPSRANLFLFFAVVAFFMYFFKKNFRKKMEKRQQNKD